MDPEQAVRVVARRYLDALVANDPVGALALMSSNAQAQLLAAARGSGVQAGTALEAMTEVCHRFREVSAAFADAEIDVVDVAGEDATATYGDPEDPDPDPADVFVLRRIEGEWLIDTFPDDEGAAGPPSA